MTRCKLSLKNYITKICIFRLIDIRNYVKLSMHNILYKKKLRFVMDYVESLES